MLCAMPIARVTRLGATGALAALAVCALGSAVTIAPDAAARPDAGGPARRAALPDRVVIRRTAHGVPHIEAADPHGLGLGYGYAFARDNICAIADDFLTVNGERSRWFGPSGISDRPAGASTNLDSDLFWRQIIDSGRVERLVARRAPLGQSATARQLVRGYAAGFNRYLRRVGGPAGIDDPTCRGKAWVKPISAGTVNRRLLQLAIVNTSDGAIQAIARAQPPGRARIARPAPRALAGLRARPGTGSNAIAVGRAGTRDGRHGLLLGNPHLPWHGTERFYQAHLTIPGRLDVAGASLYGVPAIQIGHTRSMAWSHTTAPGFGFTVYQLALAKDSPTAYMLDGRRVPMTSRLVSVTVRRRDGRLAQVARRLWSTRWGPVIGAGPPLGNLAWTRRSAFVLADAAMTNVQALDTWLAIAHAQSAPGVLRALQHRQGIPWNDTVVADRGGRALFADIRVAPNVSDALAARCGATTPGLPPFALTGLAVLDGSRSACRWGTDRDAIAPGRLGPARQPHLFRRDYVTNSNDSYWLANPHHPLEGFPRIVGDERTPRSLRTRSGLLLTQARVDGSDGLGPAGFTSEDMQRLIFGNRPHAAELTRDALVGACRALPGGLLPTSGGTPLPAGDACEVLARWDLREDLESRGAILFRRFWNHLYERNEPDSWWARPFDPSDPLHTPGTLDATRPGVMTALGDAVTELQAAGVALDARVGDVQHTVAGGRRIPVHGGAGDPHGELNMIESGFDPRSGFGPVVHGSSYVQVVTWHDGPCPDARTILTYSQSSNPRSPFATDQQPLFARKEWVPERFCRGDVVRHTLSTAVLRPGR